MESLKRINQRLVDHFGRTPDNGEPYWRIVWSEDQFENRYGTYEDRTPEGFLIREVTEWRKVPKYRQWIHEKYVLERLIVVPLTDEKTLSTQLSYEPIYIFEDKTGNSLPPNWIAAKFIVETVNRNMEQHDGVKYKDPESTPDEAKEVKEQRLKDIEESLFGNETELADALAYKQGVGFTTSKELSGKEGDN